MKLKKLSSMFLALGLVFSNFAFSEALISSQVKTVAGKPVQMVSAPVNEVYFKVGKANNTMKGSEPMANMVKRYKPAAMINANFFDAYKTLEPFGAMVQDGVVGSLGGDSNFVVINGQAKIEKVKLLLEFYISDKKYLDPKNRIMGYDYLKAFKLWQANPAVANANSFAMFNQLRAKTPALQGGTAVTVIDNKISAVAKNPGVMTVPKNGYIIFVGDNNMKPSDVKMRFADNIGQTIGFRYVKEDATPYADRIDTLISAGPIVVQEGKNIAAASKKGYESKIHSAAAQRSCIGITKDNRVVLFTTPSATMEQLGQIALALNCKEAMNLDGGASSALFAHGKYLKSPGRNLNTVLILYNRPPKVAKPAAK